MFDWVLNTTWAEQCILSYWLTVFLTIANITLYLTVFYVYCGLGLSKLWS